jgi:hypothetical protein
MKRSPFAISRCSLRPISTVVFPRLDHHCRFEDGTSALRRDVSGVDKAVRHRRAGLGSIQKGRLVRGRQSHPGRSVDEREQQFHHLSWKEFEGQTFDKGHIHLFQKKEAWSRFVLRDTCNAVCLGPLCEFQYEDSRLWKFLNG